MTEPLYLVRLSDGTELRRLTETEVLPHISGGNWVDVIPDGYREDDD